MVLVPVILGAALNQFFPRAVKQTAPFAPLVAVIAVVLILGSVMAQNAAAVTLAGPKLVGAIITLHSGQQTGIVLRALCGSWHAQSSCSPGLACQNCMCLPCSNVLIAGLLPSAVISCACRQDDPMFVPYAVLTSITRHVLMLSCL